LNSTLKNRKVLLTVDAIFFVLCLFGYYRLTQKAYTPFNLLTLDSYSVISDLGEYNSIIAVGDTVLEIDGFSFHLGEEVELYTDRKNIDDSVQVSVLKNGVTVSTYVSLTNYYSLVDLITIAFVGILFIILPMVVVFKSDDEAAIIFNWASIGLAMIMTMSSANFTVEPVSLSLLIHFLFLFAFCLTPVIYIHFICTFTCWVSRYEKLVLTLFYTSAIIIALYLSYAFLNSIFNLSLKNIQNYVAIYNDVFRYFLIFCTLFIVVTLFSAFRSTNDVITKRKIKWLILGFIGPLAFIFLWVIPILIIHQPFVPEFLMNLLLITVPASMAIAIVKYRLLDIDYLINRSVVYTIALGGLIITYIVLFTFITSVVKGINDTIPAVSAAVLVGVLLQPLKTRVQKFVDRKFFRVEYNYREEQKRFLEDIKNTNNVETLANIIVTQADELIPVDKIGFFILIETKNRIKMLAHKGFDILVGRSLKFDEENLKTNLPLPVALEDRIEQGVEVESADLKVFKRWGMVLIFPIKSLSGVFYAFLVMGQKKSGGRFYKEDVDLLNTVTATAALTIERIRLQQELIIEHLETERLVELNKMKSKFVNTVTHELKTPLTGIKLASENLQLKNRNQSKQSLEHFRIIDGESDKLDQLINNILNFAKIEERIQSYKKIPFEFNQFVRKTLMKMDYQYKMEKIELVKNIINEDFIITADKQSVEEAIMNILSNSIKYSEKNSTVIVATYTENQYVCVRIEDEGYGISKTEIENVFKPFYRSGETNIAAKPGTGLGLAIVKDIMDAHDGKIEVESKLGKGSTFTLKFPYEGSK
jgi:signal transduction histidine kinase